MNVILLYPDDFTAGGNRVLLTGRRQRHIATVHRAKVGDTLRVGLVDDRLGVGTVLRITESLVEMEVTLACDPPPCVDLTLLLALPRPASLGRILQGIAAVGVKRLYLMNTRRVEKSYWKSSAMGEDSLREHLLLGLEQAGDTRLPDVHLRPRFRPFVEDEVPRLIGQGRALLAHPDAAVPCPRGVPGPLCLAVGPEGGFIPFEVDLLSSAGFEPVSLGARPLRVEQAVPYVLGRLL